jgi:hypothetical protein
MTKKDLDEDIALFREYAFTTQDVDANSLSDFQGFIYQK